MNDEEEDETSTLSERRPPQFDDGTPHMYRFPHAVMARSPGISNIKWPWLSIFRNFILDLEVLFNVITGLIGAIWAIIVGFLTIIYPFGLWLFIFVLSWYIIVLLWTWVMLIVVLVLIPVLNILIILFNLFFMIFIVIIRIVTIIWNMFVPFLGMILQFIVNVVVKIFSEVFNVIGSIDWEPIINAIMAILMPIVDIAMQIILVLIKVGIEVITALTKVIGFLVEVIMTFVKILVPVLTWVLKFLYYILEPILQILGIFFGSIGGSQSRMASARRLFSLNGDEDDANYKNRSSYEEYEQFIIETLGLAALPAKTKVTPSDYLLEAYVRHNSEHPREHAEMKMKMKGPEMDVMSPGRTLLERAPDSFFQQHDRQQEPLKFAEQKGASESGHLDDIAHTMAHTMYINARKMPKSDLHLASHTMETILHEHKNPSHSLAVTSILNEFYEEHGYLHPHPDKTLAAVRFKGTPENPADMHVRFQEERNKAKVAFLSQNAGRKLMGQDNTDWESAQSRYLSEMKIKHARELATQQSKWKDYHMNQIKVATVVYSAASEAMKHEFENYITPQNVMFHWNNMLIQYGYDNAWDVWRDFKEKYGNSEEFLNSLSVVTEHPFFKFFKDKETKRTGQNFYFYDWMQTQRELGGNLDHESTGDESLSTGRRLMQSNQHQDAKLNRSQTSTAFPGFPVISSLGCNSEPKNQLCIPEVPANFTFSIPQVHLTRQVEKQLLHDPHFCPPWKYTLCFFCVDRLFNAWQDIRFLLSAIPIINYGIATWVTLIPWLNPLFNWMFMVPKFETAKLIQWGCFAYHLYDLGITLILLWVAYRILNPFFLLARHLWTHIREIRRTQQHHWFRDRELRAIERFVGRARRREDNYASIGSSISPPSGASKRLAHPNHHINENINDLFEMVDDLPSETNQDVRNSIHSLLEHIHSNLVNLDEDISDGEADLIEEELMRHPLHSLSSSDQE